MKEADPAAGRSACDEVAADEARELSSWMDCPSRREFSNIDVASPWGEPGNISEFDVDIVGLKPPSEAVLDAGKFSYMPLPPGDCPVDAALVAAAAAAETEVDPRSDLPTLQVVLGDGPCPLVGVAERLEKRDANRATFPLPPPPPPPDFDGVDAEATLAAPLTGAADRATPGDDEAAAAVP